MKSRTIDLTPDRQQSARVVYYVLGSHLNGKHHQFGEYWSLTPTQEDALFETYAKLDGLRVGSFDWVSLPASHRSKLILSLHKAILENLTTAN